MSVDRSPAILVLQPDSNPEHAFAGEILKAEGLFDFETVARGACPPETLARARCALALRGSYEARAADGLVDFVQRGGRLIALMPGGLLGERLGVRRRAGFVHWKDTGKPKEGENFNPAPVPHGRVSTRLGSDLPVCPEPLYCPGDTAQSMDCEGEILADLTDEYGKSCGPAIVRKRIGKGTAVILAHDVVGAVLRLRHGTWNLAQRPELPSLLGPRHINGLIGIAERHSRQYPLADIHQDVLRNLLITAMALPVTPRIWHLPDAQRVAVFMKSDGCGEEGTPVGLELAERHGHKHNFFRAPVSRYEGRLIREWRQRGHCMSVEVDIYEHTMDRRLEELDAKAHEGIRRTIEEQTQRFTRETGLELTDIVIHGCQWSGAPTAQILMDHGWRMPFHFCSHDPRMNRHDFGPFSVASAMPMRYFDRARGLLDLFLQPCSMDDSQTVAEPGVGTVGLNQVEYAEKIIHWVTESRDRWHVPHIGTFHPCYLIRPREDPRRTWELATMVYAAMAALGIEMGNLEDWSRFVQARDALRVEIIRSDATATVMKLTAPKAVEGLTILGEARNLVSEILLDGKPQPLQTLEIEGRARSAAVISLAQGQESELIIKL